MSIGTKPSSTVPGTGLAVDPGLNPFVRCWSELPVPPSVEAMPELANDLWQASGRVNGAQRSRCTRIVLAGCRTP
jgi:hypothetical protein